MVIHTNALVGEVPAGPFIQVPDAMPAFGTPDYVKMLGDYVTSYRGVHTSDSRSNGSLSVVIDKALNEAIASRRNDVAAGITHLALGSLLNPL